MTNSSTNFVHFKSKVAFFWHLNNFYECIFDNLDNFRAPPWLDEELNRWIDGLREIIIDN